MKTFKWNQALACRPLLALLIALLLGPHASGQQSTLGGSGAGKLTYAATNLARLFSSWHTNQTVAGSFSGSPNGWWDGTQWNILATHGTNSLLATGATLGSLTTVGDIITNGAGGAWDQFGALGPTPFIENGTNYILYNSPATAGDNPGNIGIAYAQSGTTNYTKYSGNPILNLSNSITWESSGLFHGFLTKSGSKYFLFYNGKGSSAEQIGFATATSIFGPYTRYSGNPVIANGLWDNTIIGDPCVQRVGAWWVMLYYSTGTGNGTRLGGAYSWDLTNWMRFPENPIFETGQGSQLIRPGLVNSNDVYYLLTESVTANAFDVSLPAPVDYIGGFDNGIQGKIGFNNINGLAIGPISVNNTLDGISRLGVGDNQPTLITVIRNGQHSFQMADDGTAGYIASESTKPIVFMTGGAAQNFNGTHRVVVNSSGLYTTNGSQTLLQDRVAIGSGFTLGSLGTIGLQIGSGGNGGSSLLPQLFMANYVSTGTSRPGVIGGWNSSGYWAMGAATSANDNTLRVGAVAFPGNNTDWAATPPAFTLYVAGTNQMYGLNVGIQTPAVILTNVVYTNVTLNFPSTSAQSFSDLLVNIANVKSNDIVHICPPASAQTNGIFSAWISNTVVYARYHNYQGTAIDPASGIFNLKLEQYQ